MFSHLKTFVFGTSTALLALVMPFVASAQARGEGCLANFDSFGQIAQFLRCFINNSIIPILFGIAVIGFFFGVIRFVIGGRQDETKRQQGRTYMLWSILAIFVMVAVWGILQVLTGTFGFSFGIPQF
jgi:hypothetical protein